VDPYYEQWAVRAPVPDSYAYQLVDEFRGAPTLDKTTFGKWVLSLQKPPTGDSS